MFREAKADVFIFFVMGDMSFPRIEKMMADPSAAIRLEQDRIAKGEVRIDLYAPLLERFCKEGSSSTRG